jgi:hypothetical protein
MHPLDQLELLSLQNLLLYLKLFVVAGLSRRQESVGTVDHSFALRPEDELLAALIPEVLQH